jgi:undecaprenyl-diphosphatase
VFAAHKVEFVEPDELGDRMARVVHDEPDVPFIGIAGGDGSVRCAVEVLTRANSSIPLLVVPAGTRNHFATDLGITDFDTAAAAADDGVIRNVDLGAMNDAVFVNNSSVGMYPSLVNKREEHEERLPKWMANLVAAWDQLRHGHRVRLEIDGAPRRVWLVFVGNDCYGQTVLDLTGRERLDEGVLDVRIARGEGRLSRLRIAGAVLFGRLDRSPLIERRTCSALVLDTKGPIDVALDGEVVRVPSPLEYRSCPGALRVLVPR